MIHTFKHVKEKFKRTKILVIGDIILDHYIYGKTNRISPEAPIPIVNAQSEKYVLGGAANVVNNLKALGAEATIAGFIGKDQEGDIIKKLLPSKKNILIASKKPTTLKTRILSQNQQLLRIDREDTSEEEIKNEEKFCQALIKLFQKSQFHAVIVSDYAKGVISKSIFKCIISLTKKHQIPVIVDPKKNDFAFYKGADYIKPNLKETQDALNQSLLDGSNDLAMEEAGKKLLKKCQAKGLLISRNKYGLSMIQKNHSYHFCTFASEVSDVSGAGDTVISIFSLGLAAGFSTEFSAELSNLGAGVVVQKQGTATVTPEEILKKWQKQHAYKISEATDRNELKDLIQMEKSLGNRVAFTNGCFDLLHPGHIKLLEEARKCGDILVVAINSDKSVQKLKGKGRPLIPQEDRARVLLGLTCVDYVVIFHEDTPRPLLRLLKPDILIKGGDYTHDQVVGWEIVEAYGGIIKTIKFVDGKSTTTTLNNILNKNK